MDHKATLVTDATGSITLTLAPYESCFLVRSTSAGQPAAVNDGARTHESTTGRPRAGPRQVTAGHGDMDRAGARHWPGWDYATPPGTSQAWRRTRRR